MEKRFKTTKKRIPLHYKFNKIKGLINLILGLTLGIEVLIKYPREAIEFGKVYFNNRRITVIEVGVFEGKGAESILKSLNVDKVFLIDPYEKYDNYKEDPCYNHLVKAKQKAFKKLKRFNNKIQWILDYSSNASKKINRKVDFVYMDGNNK